jgi:hypothetical protein
MTKFLTGLALSVALVAGSAAAISTSADAAGIYVNVGGHHHHHWRGYYWHHQYWHNRYHCHHGWCYR